jgi:hypothetical protein
VAIVEDGVVNHGLCTGSRINEYRVARHLNPERGWSQCGPSVAGGSSSPWPWSGLESHWQGKLLGVLSGS